VKRLIIGCGYLGRRVARAWLARGDQVTALTRSPANASSLLAMGIEPVLGDVMNPQSLASLPDAETLLYAVGRDRASGHSQRQVAVDGLRDALAELTARVDRVISISSTSVYGQSTGEWVDEVSPTVPTRPGGLACLEAEALLWQRVAQQGRAPAANVLRLAGLYGPGRLLRRIESLKTGAPIDGNPHAFLNLVHVDDAAEAVLACDALGKPGETYLVCDDRPVARREYFEKLAALVGAPEPVFAENAKSGGANALNKRCSNRRLREELRVTLQFPDIDTGLPHAVRHSTGS
jgi:nucleoside-diphosphate-sugar epimerase